MQANLEESKLQSSPQQNGNGTSRKEDNYLSPELLNNIGVLRLEVGNVKEAEESFKKALEM